MGLGQLANGPSRLEVRLDQKQAFVHKRTSALGVSYVLTHALGKVSPMS
jgi:hypothetical protein